MQSHNATEPNPAGEFDSRYAIEQIRRSQQPLRRFIKGFYLDNMLKQIDGPTIDFGCGAGQLLKKLPKGSEGLEVNPFLISELKKSGLTVHRANANLQDFELLPFRENFFRTLIIAHVLEHLPDPVAALKILFTACMRIGVRRVVIVLPGAKGFKSDHTHKTYINRAYVRKNIIHHCNGFNQTSLSYFPGPWEFIGEYFVFHEMMVVFDHLGA
ncbi:bifunctional 2-polyprenyl-6-hydroxyphenol methylase/3-demethylubiquinol 3-O-methyltransferase UbiG [Rhodoferax sp. U11-2br]|uniref:class I SAM-dependent methyltransferase n=1 Tax=Rhodoferax sp. U11-2br TaxID=2838878 RepID=UPI001BED13DB|nr:methyltransferase domain-containing protein [Rhodoferax sp. U11-2br]MBT3067043.1 methyltransferase domain-containing protein [Rhodoferax sp. U11-2br]